MNKHLSMGFSTLALVLMTMGSTTANETFTKNCAACHNGGGNIMKPDKTLSKEHLEKNGVNSADAIKDLIAKGKSPMPAFEKVLDESQINEVANYVLEQARERLVSQKITLRFAY